MNSIVGVRFRKPGKVYFFDPDNLDIEKGQKVIVETNQGQEIGEVTTDKKEIHQESVKAQAVSFISKYYKDRGLIPFDMLPSK